MIISSYEGVIRKRQGKNTLLNNFYFYSNLHAIKEYVKTNNDLLLVTKRKPEYIFKEIEKYKILYTYLCIYNGLVTIDNNRQIINAEYIDKDKVKEVLKTIKKLNLESAVRFYNAFGEKNDDYQEDIVLIEFKSRNIVPIAQLIKDLNLGYSYSSQGFVLNNNINKMVLLERVLKIIDCNDFKMITDFDEDMAIIKKYDGYVVTDGKLSKYYKNNITLKKLLKDNSKSI